MNDEVWWRGLLEALGLYLIVIFLGCLAMIVLVYLFAGLWDFVAYIVRRLKR